MPIRRDCINASLPSLEPVLFSFLPTELYGKCKFISSIGRFVCLDERVSYYGTDIDFSNAITLYQQFAGSHTHLKMDVAVPFNVTPVVYANLASEPFIYKQDFLVAVQHAVNFTPYPECHNYFIFAIIGHYLKSKEKFLEGKFEFATFDSKVLDNLSAQLMQKMEEHMNHYNEMNVDESNYAGLTFQSVFEKLTEILPVADKDPNYTSLFELLEKYEEYTPLQTNLKLYSELLIWIECIILEIDNFWKSRPEWFLPNNPKTSKTYIRVFQDCGKDIIMATDILQYVTPESREYVMSHADKGILLTIGFDVFCKEVKDPNIDFILYPIRRSKARASFIPSLNEKFCILSSDLLWETLSELISVKGVFQNINQENFTVVQSFFKDAERIFDTKLPCTYFVDTEVAYYLKMKCDEHFNAHIGKLFKPYTPARKLGTNGFTLEELMTEVKYIGLMDSAFASSMLDYADLIYQRRVKNVGRSELKVHDLYGALEDIQMMCVFRNLPRFNRFLHIQGACIRGPFNCNYCHSDKLTIKFPTVPIFFKTSAPRNPPTQVAAQKMTIEVSPKKAEVSKEPKSEPKEKEAGKKDTKVLRRPRSNPVYIPPAEKVTVEAEKENQETQPSVGKLTVEEKKNKTNAVSKGSKRAESDNKQSKETPSPTKEPEVEATKPSEQSSVGNLTTDLEEMDQTAQSEPNSEPQEQEQPQIEVKTRTQRKKENRRLRKEAAFEAKTMETPKPPESYQDLKTKHFELETKLAESEQRNKEKDEEIASLKEQIIHLEASLVHYIQNR